MTEQELTIELQRFHSGRIMTLSEAERIISALIAEVEALKDEQQGWRVAVAEREAVIAFVAGERDALKAQLREARKWIEALEDTITPEMAHEASALCNHREEDET